MRFGVVLVLVTIAAMVGIGGANADDEMAIPDPITLTGVVVLPLPDATIPLVPPDLPQPLPAGALLTVTLEDIARADAPAVEIAQVQIEPQAGPAPIPFTLAYSASAVPPGALYAARARVTLGDRLLFTTTDVNQVDPFNPLPIELRLQAVPSADAPPPPDASLTDTYWKLVQVNGTPVEVGDGREPNLVLSGDRFSGSGGVNRLMGGYTLDGQSLVFTAVALTMMAGPPAAMAQEQAIVAALDQVRGYAIAGDRLTLTDATARPVLEAVAVALG